MISSKHEWRTRARRAEAQLREVQAELRIANTKLGRDRKLEKKVPVYEWRTEYADVENMKLEIKELRGALRSTGEVSMARLKDLRDKQEEVENLKKHLESKDRMMESDYRTLLEEANRRQEAEAKLQEAQANLRIADQRAEALTRDMLKQVESRKRAQEQLKETENIARQYREDKELTEDKLNTLIDAVLDLKEAEETEVPEDD